MLSFLLPQKLCVCHSFFITNLPHANTWFRLLSHQGGTSHVACHLKINMRIYMKQSSQKCYGIAPRLHVAVLVQLLLQLLFCTKGFVYFWMFVLKWLAMCNITLWCESDIAVPPLPPVVGVWVMSLTRVWWMMSLLCKAEYQDVLICLLDSNYWLC